MDTLKVRAWLRLSRLSASMAVEDKRSRSKVREEARRNSLLASILYAIYPEIGPALSSDSFQGTTFSGVAFAFATNTEAKEDIITEWPGAGNQTKQKVRPTASVS